MQTEAHGRDPALGPRKFTLQGGVEGKAILGSAWEPQTQGLARGLRREGVRMKIMRWRSMRVGARGGRPAEQEVTTPCPIGACTLVPNPFLRPGQPRRHCLPHPPSPLQSDWLLWLWLCSLPGPTLLLSH